MPTRAPGRREHRKHLTRKELLLAGRRLFGDKGLYDSRIEDLTGRAGIAKGTLYGYFANKQELIQAVVAAGFQDLLAAVRERARWARNDRERIGLVVGAHLDFFAANPDLMRVFHQVRGVLKFNRREWRPLRATLATYLEELAAVLGNGAGAGRGAARRGELARMLFGAVSGVASVGAALAPDLPGRPLPAAAPRALVALGMALVATENGYEPAAARPARSALRGTAARASRRRRP